MIKVNVKDETWNLKEEISVYFAFIKNKLL